MRGDTNLDQLDWQLANEPQPDPEPEDFPDEDAMTPAEQASYERWMDRREAEMILAETAAQKAEESF